MVAKENDLVIQEEIEPKEAPSMLVLGKAGEELLRLTEAGEQAGFLVRSLPSLETLPPRSELDPDLVVATSQWYISHSASLPVSFQTRLIRMVDEDGWSSIKVGPETHLVSAQANVAELAFRLPELLKRIQQQAWKRLGLPMVGSQEALWELIPSTDWVTGLDNRLRFLQELQKNVSCAKRYKRPFCCLLVQFDNFEALVSSGNGMDDVNFILEEVAGVLQVSIRDADFLARMQNNLFGLLLPETDLENAQVVLARIKKNLEQFQFSRTFPELPRFSCGISPFDYEISTADSLLQEAQRALEVIAAL